MSAQIVNACVPVDISDQDIFEAMKDIPGYLDITPGDFKELYIKAHQRAVFRLARAVKAGHVMTGKVVSVEETTPLEEVAQLMAQNRISGVPVVTEDKRVAGIISEKDFLAVMGAGGAQKFMEVITACLFGKACLAVPSRKKVAADIMTSPAVTVLQDTPIMEVAEIFTNRGINRVPVVDENSRLVGIVSRADVVRSSLLLEAT